MPQTEKIPTLTPPPAPPSGSEPGGHGPSRGPRTPTEWERYSKRILGWAFLASIFINLGFGVWLGYTDIYGTQRTSAEQHRIKIQLYRPPIKHPKKPKPPPPPPKPKIKPPPLKIVHLKVPPPHIIPRTPPPPRPSPPQPVHVGAHTTSVHAIPVGPPEPVAPPTPAVPVNPSPVPTPPAPTPPTPAPPAPTPPAPTPVQAPPAPRPAPPPAPKPPPPPPPKPKGWVDVDSRQASVDDSSIPQVDTSGVDSSTITGPCVVSFDVDINGHISSARVSKSSGSADFDDACLKAIRQAHGVPGVQDHILYRASARWTFSAG